jgi:hypothetical protein
MLFPVNRKIRLRFTKLTELSKTVTFRRVGGLKSSHFRWGSPRNLLATEDLRQFPSHN